MSNIADADADATKIYITFIYRYILAPPMLIIYYENEQRWLLTPDKHGPMVAHAHKYCTQFVDKFNFYFITK